MRVALGGSLVFPPVCRGFTGRYYKVNGAEARSEPLIAERRQNLINNTCLKEHSNS